MPVFFDFSDSNKSIFWFLLPFDIADEAYLISFSQNEFIDVLNKDGFDELVFKLIPKIKDMIIEHKLSISNSSMNYLLNKRIRRKNRSL